MRAPVGDAFVSQHEEANRVPHGREPVRDDPMRAHQAAVQFTST